MFFFFSIMPKTEEIGSCDGWNIYRTCSVFYLFFIPICKWNKRYYVKKFNSDTYYELNPEVGKKAEENALFSINESDLIVQNVVRTCPHCHQELDDTYSFCPYCGTKL